ncbi:hypothetical protein IGI65_001571 [Enterococcus sp. DIV0755b]|uniref:hypothetical protein n=1 Tax=Enterococcus sp. DIV0755b TaxID=2774657 RepID=UPI003F245526
MIIKKEIEMICPKCKKNGVILNNEYLELFDRLETNYEGNYSVIQELIRQKVYYGICKNEECNFVVESLDNVGYNLEKSCYFWKEPL